MGWIADITDLAKFRFLDMIGNPVDVPLMDAVATPAQSYVNPSHSPSNDIDEEAASTATASESIPIVSFVPEAPIEIEAAEESEESG
jgi:hypothetical protein